MESYQGLTVLEEKTRNGILSTLSGCSGDMCPGA